MKMTYQDFKDAATKLPEAHQEQLIGDMFSSLNEKTVKLSEPKILPGTPTLNGIPLLSRVLLRTAELTADEKQMAKMLELTEEEFRNDGRSSETKKLAVKEDVNLDTLSETERLARMLELTPAEVLAG